MGPESSINHPSLPAETFGHVLYGTLGFLALAGLPLALAAAWLRPAWRRSLAERLAIGLPRSLPEGRCVWLHAASVGEVLALSALIDRLHCTRPDLRLVLSTQTSTGRQVAREHLSALSGVFYFPLDLPGFPGRVLDRLRPVLVLVAETEIWPGLLFAAARRSVPTAIVSGRVSPKAFAWYRRARALFAPALGTVSRLCVQSGEDARRFLALGAQPDRVIVTGSLKSGASPRSHSRPPWLAAIGAGERPIVVAGSTHAGEEVAVLKAFAAARKEVPEALLVLAPRHPRRFGEVASLVGESGLSYVLRSDLVEREKEAAGVPSGPAVVLLDTIGELAGCYRSATVAFVGGSLVDIGGHNLFEPALSRCPVLFGPHTQNGEEAARQLLEAKGAERVADEEELALWFARLLADPEGAKAMGERAFAAVAASAAEPVRLTLEAISVFLEGRP